MDLIDIDRAREQIPGAPTSDDPVIASIISACSGVVEIYCNRTFAQAAYDEVHTVSGPTCSLWCNNPPITDIDAVRSSPLPAFYVLLSDPGNTVQRGTVDITATSVVLKRTYLGTTTPTTLLFASYPLMSDLYAAVNLLGNGWTATGLNSQLANWLTSDLTTNLGTRNARNVACPLWVYWWYLADYRVNKVTGEIHTAPMPGFQEYRLQYTGGYAATPEPVQQAVAELVQLVYASRRANPLMQSETLDRYSYARAVPANWLDLISSTSRAALNQFRIPRLTTSGVNAKA